MTPLPCTLYLIDPSKVLDEDVLVGMVRITPIAGVVVAGQYETAFPLASKIIDGEMERLVIDNKPDPIKRYSQIAKTMNIRIAIVGLRQDVPLITC